MSNTIEKALQRQREAAQKKKNEEALAKAEAEAAATSEQREPSTLDKIQEPEEPQIVEAAEVTAVPEPVIEKPLIADKEPESLPASAEKDADYIVDLQRLEARGHVSLLTKRSQINEEYREIKRKLLTNAFGKLSLTLKNSNIIMVTSGRPSEGKTFTAVNLALSIAIEQDKTVLLVDADVLRPNVCNTLGVEKRKGLIEYLVGEVDDLSEVMYHTNIDKLKIIPSGKSHHLSTELLASQKMHDTVDEFANRYSDRVVIFDTPPIIGINESAILANFAGQAVVVTEEGSSKLGDIKFAVERLNPDMAIGFVVNKSVNTDTEGTGYYGYYYAEREA